MANETMVLLEKIVVPSGGASSIEFTSIPQSYTDLCIVTSVRFDQSSDNGLYIQFNGDVTGTSYSRRYLYGDGSSASSSSSSSTNRGMGGVGARSNSTASTFANSLCYIPNYAGSDNKSVSVDGVNENNATSADAMLWASLWSNSAAITSIKLSPNTGNIVQYSTFYLYGVAKQGVTPTNAPAATGGDKILFDGTYWYHVFTSTGTFTPKKGLTCDYLVVAGGGGSGGGTSGGGGAGGARSTVTSTGRGGSLESPLSLTASTNYTVTIGAGGTAGTTDGSSGGNGSNSVFSTITSTGGGGGIHGSTGLSGGSGGGAGYGPNVEAGGAGTTGQGYDGGSCTANGSPYFTGAGGGGAGAAGASVVTSHTGGAGGNGIWTALTNAVSVGQLSGGNYYVAGGGAGGNGSGTVSGGLGGGGSSTDNTNGVAGTVNTGGGAGGPGTDGTKSGATGGSGIVIVRYAA